MYLLVNSLNFILDTSPVLASNPKALTWSIRTEKLQQMHTLLFFKVMALSLKQVACEKEVWNRALEWKGGQYHLNACLVDGAGNDAFNGIYNWDCTGVYAMNGVWHGQPMIFSFVFEGVSAANYGHCKSWSRGVSSGSACFCKLVFTKNSLIAHIPPKAGWIMVSDRFPALDGCSVDCLEDDGEDVKDWNSHCSAFIFTLWIVLL